MDNLINFSPLYTDIKDTTFKLFKNNLILIGVQINFKKTLI